MCLIILLALAILVGSGVLDKKDWPMREYQSISDVQSACLTIVAVAFIALLAYLVKRGYDNFK